MTQTRRDLAQKAEMQRQLKSEQLAIALKLVDLGLSKVDVAKRMNVTLSRVVYLLRPK